MLHKTALFKGAVKDKGGKFLSHSNFQLSFKPLLQPPQKKKARKIPPIRYMYRTFLRRQALQLQMPKADPFLRWLLIATSNKAFCGSRLTVANNHFFFHFCFVFLYIQSFRGGMEPPLLTLFAAVQWSAANTCFHFFPLLCFVFP